MRRLFSSFADGAPGVGLLLMRLAAGAILIVRAITELAAAPSLAHAVWEVIGGASGVLLLVGLWTPIAGVVAALYVAWSAFVDAAHLEFYILLGAMGAALALLGPGAWSIDARLFGWKRVEIPNGKRQDRPSS